MSSKSAAKVKGKELFGLTKKQTLNLSEVELKKLDHRILERTKTKDDQEVAQDDEQKDAQKDAQEYQLKMQQLMGYMYRLQVHFETLGTEFQDDQFNVWVIEEGRSNDEDDDHDSVGSIRFYVSDDDPQAILHVEEEAYKCRTAFMRQPYLRKADNERHKVNKLSTAAIWNTGKTVVTCPIRRFIKLVDRVVNEMGDGIPVYVNDTLIWRGILSGSAGNGGVTGLYE